MKMVALIPARAGSKRIPGKNTRLLAGHPLIVYAIRSALESGVFSQVFVCSDDPAVQCLAYVSGVFCVTREAVPDDEPDIRWVRRALFSIKALHGRPDQFAIIRPTSPFRTAETIRRAYRVFTSPGATMDSLRAVEPVTQHPGKMWTCEGPGYPITPLLDETHETGIPWHSSPTQTLPRVYIQNACLEMSWTRNVEIFGSISGRKIAPFFTEGHEGFDLNTEDDWRRAETLLARGEATLPPLSLATVSPLPAA